MNTEIRNKNKEFLHNIYKSVGKREDKMSSFELSSFCDRLKTFTTYDRLNNTEKDLSKRQDIKTMITPLGGESIKLEKLYKHKGTRHSSLRSILKVENGRLVYIDKENKTFINIYGNKTLEQCIVEETPRYVIYSDGVKTEADPIPEGIYFSCRIDKITGEIWTGKGYTNLANGGTRTATSLTTVYKDVENGLMRVEQVSNPTLNSGAGLYIDASRMKTSTEYRVSWRVVTNPHNFVYLVKHFGLLDIPSLQYVGGATGTSTGITKAVRPSTWEQYYAFGWYINTTARDKVGSEFMELEVIMTEGFEEVPFVRTKCPDFKLSLAVQDLDTSKLSFIMRDAQHSLKKGATTYVVPVYAEFTSSYLSNSGAGEYSFECRGTGDFTGIRGSKYVDVLYSPVFNLIKSQTDALTGNLQHNGTLESTASVMRVCSEDTGYALSSIKSLTLYENALTEDEIKAEFAIPMELESYYENRKNSTNLLGIEDIFTNGSSEIVEGQYTSRSTRGVFNEAIVFALMMDPNTRLLTINKTVYENALTLRLANGKRLDDCIVSITDDYVIYSDGDVTIADPIPEGIYFACILNRHTGAIRSNIGFTNQPSLGNYYGKDLVMVNNNNYSFTHTKQGMFALLQDVPAGAEKVSISFKIRIHAKGPVKINGFYPNSSDMYFGEIDEDGWQEVRSNLNFVGDVSIRKIHFYASNEPPFTENCRVDIKNMLIVYNHHFIFQEDYCETRCPTFKMEIANSRITTKTHSFFMSGIKTLETTNAGSNIIMFSRKKGENGNIYCSRSRFFNSDSILVSRIYKQTMKDGVPTNIDIIDTTADDEQLVNTTNMFICFPEYDNSRWCPHSFKKVIIAEGQTTEEQSLEYHKGYDLGSYDNAFATDFFLSEKTSIYSSFREIGNPDEYTSEPLMYGIGDGFIENMKKDENMARNFSNIPGSVRVTEGPVYSDKFIDSPNHLLTHPSYGSNGIYGLKCDNVYGNKSKDLYARLVFIP